MKVLLTGAFGNLGVATINELLRQGHKVRCFDIPSKANKKKAVQFAGKIETIWGDIRDPALVKQAVAEQEAVIHNAAVLPPVTERKKEMARAINVDGTRYIVEAAEESPTLPLVVYSSSVTVHGPGDNREPPVSSKDPLNPTDQYSTHKVECEKILEESKLSWVVLRIGVALDPNARDADKDSFSTLFDVSPDTRLEYVHPLDVARAQVNALSCPEVKGRVLLIGGGRACRITYRELFKAIFDAIGIGMLPRAAFGTDTFYTDWMDTKESQEHLKYQFLTFEDYRRDLIHSMRFIRWAVFPVRPIVRGIISGFSEPWKTRHFKNRVAVVTGAAGGLGRAISVCLAKKGCDLALADINQEELNNTAELVRSNGRKASIHLIDVSDKKQMAMFPEAVIKEHGHVHILVNNAGVTYFGTIEEQPVEDLEWIVGINLWGVVFGCKYFLPFLQKEDESHIVNLSSMTGFLGLPIQGAYSATKSAIRAFSESLWAELSPTSVGVTVVQPGGIRTGLLKTSRGSEDAPDKKRLIKIIDRFAISPERAAKKIVRAIEKKKMRLLLCPESYILEWAKRLFPVKIHSVFAWYFRVFRKKS